MIGLDSTFIIDLLSGNSQAASKAQQLRNEIKAVTPLNHFEVFLGIFLRIQSKKEEKRAAADFFANVDVLPLTPSAAIEAARIESELIRAGKEMTDIDILLAGTYLSHGYTKIVTRDKAFSRVKGLTVISY